MKKHNYKQTILVLLYILFSILAVSAQRTGSASQGGSIRPERLPETKPSSTSIIAQPPSLLGMPTPQPTPRSKKEKCDPNTVDGTCPGTFSFSYGFGANASPRRGGNSSLKGGFAFATYIHKRVFVELDNDNFISTKDSLNKRKTGIGDTNIYIGGDLFLEKKSTPSLTVLYGLKVPTASATKGIGSGKVDHTILGAISKTFGSIKKTYIEFDLGNSFAGTDSGFDNYPFAAFLVKQKLDKKNKFTAHFEIGGTFKASGYEGDAYNLTYLETKLNETISIRTGGKFGITNNLSKAGLFLGLKFSGNLKNFF